MIRTGPSAKAAIFSAILVLAAFAPAHARASKPSTVSVITKGAGTPVAASENRRDEDSRLLVTGDFNGDGIADIAEVTVPAGAHSGPSVLTVSLGRADGTFKQMASKQILGHNPKSMVVGDFNRDGNQDLIVGDADGALMLFLGDGTGNLIPAGEIAHLDSVVSIAVADFNHDGIPDIAVSDWRASSVVLFLGAGNGSFRREWSFALRMPGTEPTIAAGDFNGDGIPDLAVVYGGDEGDYTYDVMLGDGKGTFTNAPKLSFVNDPGCPTL